MPKNSSAGRRERARALAKAEGISYSAALRRLTTETAAPTGGGAEDDWATESRTTAALRHWGENNALTSSGHGDPYQQAAAMGRRALLWGEFGALLHRLAEGRLDLTEAEYTALLERVATGCAYAAILDQEGAARIRHRHRIPTLQPGTQLALLHLETCPACGRPWQVEEAGACPACPATIQGVSPESREDAAALTAAPDTSPPPGVEPRRIGDLTLTAIGHDRAHNIMVREAAQDDGLRVGRIETIETFDDALEDALENLPRNIVYAYRSALAPGEDHRGAALDWVGQVWTLDAAVAILQGRFASLHAPLCGCGAPLTQIDDTWWDGSGRTSCDLGGDHQPWTP